jgi:hypothetical protein
VIAGPAPAGRQREVNASTPRYHLLRTRKLIARCDEGGWSANQRQQYPWYENTCPDQLLPISDGSPAGENIDDYLVW